MPSSTTTTTSAITISYELNPPNNVDVSGLEPKKTHTVAVEQGDQKTFYRNLQAAISEAKTLVGEDLTVWRDRVGKTELTKEPPPKGEDDEDEEDEEESV
jgi:hypothetical protein